MKISGLKKIITAGILTVLIIPSISFGFGSWTQETTARELCFLYTLSKDWQQTLDLAGRSVGYREERPALASYPAINNGNLYDAPDVKQQTLISYLLPPEFSELWQIEEPGIQSVDGN